MSGSSPEAPLLPSFFRSPLPRRPLPLPDRGLSGEYSNTSPDGVLTASGLNRIDGDLAKWNTGSQAFLKRLFQPPGTPLRVLRQHSSSTNLHRHSRTCAMVKSFTDRKSTRLNS